MNKMFVKLDNLWSDTSVGTRKAITSVGRTILPTSSVLT